MTNREQPLFQPDHATEPGAIIERQVHEIQELRSQLAQQRSFPRTHAELAQELLDRFTDAAQIIPRSEQTERLADENRVLREAIMTDPLTGIGNRRRLETVYERLVYPHPQRRSIEAAPVNEQEHTALLVDADHFKDVNDTYGHHVGDQVLQGIAGVLKNSVRERDIVGRAGGEEFVVLLPRTTPDQAARIAEGIRSKVEDTPFAEDGLYVTVSIGVGRIMAAETFSEGIKPSDDALYAAKDQGRNRVVWLGDNTPGLE